MAALKLQFADVLALHEQFKGISDGLNVRKTDSHLISFDANDPQHVFAAVSYGDLDTAKKSVWIIPGMGSSARDRGSYGGRAFQLKQDIRGSIATVAWLGYKSPNEANVGQIDPAVAGGKKLAHALNGYNSVKPTGAQTTILAHSYGSTTAWEALSKSPNRLGVTNFITIGSAGIRATNAYPNLESVKSLHTFSTKAHGDLWSGIGIWDSNTIQGPPRIKPQEAGATNFGSNGATIGGRHYVATDHHGLDGSDDGDRESLWDPGNESYLVSKTESNYHIINIVKTGKP